MDKKFIIEQLKKYAVLYETNLINKEFLVLAKSSSNIMMFDIMFDRTNFLHLTGLQTKLSPIDFFNAVINNRLRENDFSFKYDNITTSKKLGALPHLVNIHTIARNIGDYNNRGIHLKTDKIMGNQVVSLGLVYTKDQSRLHPNSLMGDDSRQLTVKPFLPIIAILSKEFANKQFDTITYKSKNINIEKLHFSKDLQALLTLDALKQLKPNINKNKEKQEAFIEDLTFDADKPLNTPNKLKTSDKGLSYIDKLLADAKVGADAYNNRRQQTRTPEKESRNDKQDVSL